MESFKLLSKYWSWAKAAVQKEDRTRERGTQSEFCFPDCFLFSVLKEERPLHCVSCFVQYTSSWSKAYCDLKNLFAG